MILFLLLLSSNVNAIDFMGLQACSKRYADVARLENAAFEKFPALLALKKAMEQETFQIKILRQAFTSSFRTTATAE